MTATFIDIIDWSGGRDDAGQRTFECVSRVHTNDVRDGPSVVMYASGLPAIGSSWTLGNDNDTYVYCTPYMQVRRAADAEGEIGYMWDVMQRFTTNGMPRCNTVSVDNPLSEPAKVSGGFVSRMEEALYDKDGYLLLTSSLERMKGKEIEVDMGSPTVRISINVGTLPLTTFAQYRGGVNNATLWGLPARCIRLADINWERNVYGVCGYYYTITYDFQVRFETWNRFIPDMGSRSGRVESWLDNDPPTEGTGLLIGYEWFPPMRPITDDEGKPYSAFLNGQSIRCSPERYVSGLPAAEDPNHPDNIHIWEKKLETEFNFLLLGIPTSL